MTIQNERDLLGLMRIGKICAQTLHYMIGEVRAGMTTGELDKLGAAHLRKLGARSAPMLMYRYPAATCISINEQIAHAIPGSRIIQPGDVVNVDVSAELDGYIADTGFTVVVPPAAEAAEKLLARTQAALNKAIDIITAGAPLNQIGRVVEGEARKHGYKVLRELGGHGVGRALHEYPRNIPNYFAPQLKSRMTDGMVFTVEPFFNTGTGVVVQEKDGWTLTSADKSLSAQFEHTVVVTRNKPVIVTAL
jgi:methionyl aminopeptidase